MDIQHQLNRTHRTILIWSLNNLHLLKKLSGWKEDDEIWKMNVNTILFTGIYDTADAVRLNRLREVMKRHGYGIGKNGEVVFDTNSPAGKRLRDKIKYGMIAVKLEKGDWGWITQSLLDFVETKVSVTFTQMKEYYDVTLRGNKTIIEGGSFIHHLHSLTALINAQNRRCGRYLVKRDSDGKYITAQYN